MDITIAKVDHEDSALKERLYGFLAPVEAHSLFITGNLKNGFPDSHIYVAERGGEWVGVAGYYGAPQSMVPVSPDPEAVRALVGKIAESHSPIVYLNAIADTARVACDELRDAGYRINGDPRQAFMQLDGLPPRTRHEELTRLMAPADHEAVVRLLRHLRGRPQELPVTEEELRKVRMNPRRFVVVVDGEVVSVASTNGVGIAAAQILGVATAEAHRGKGYAGAACAALVRAMSDEGARQTIIFTGMGNAPARRCYEKLGFRVTGEYWVTDLTRESEPTAK